MRSRAFITFAATTDLRAREIWSAVLDGLPEGWSRLPPEPALCIAIGIEPADFCQIRSPRAVGTRPHVLTLIRQGAEVQLVNVIPDERRYEEPLTGQEAAVAVGSFAAACVKPHLDPQVQIRPG
jgi:hypothetical protein